MSPTVTVTIAFGDGAEVVHAGPVSTAAIPTVPAVPDAGADDSASHDGLADIPPPPDTDRAVEAAASEAVPPPPDGDGSEAGPDSGAVIAAPPDVAEAAAPDGGTIPPPPGETSEGSGFEPASEDFPPPPEE
jgi:hypothetical protein